MEMARGLQFADPSHPHWHSEEITVAMDPDIL